MGYAEGDFDPEGYIFYLATHDAGAGWVLFMDINAPPPAHVNYNTTALPFDNSGDFYAVWDEVLAITHDGGRTSLLWNPLDCGYRAGQNMPVYLQSALSSLTRIRKQRSAANPGGAATTLSQSPARGLTPA